MADIYTKRKRSEVMSLVRSTGNKSTELRFIALMRAAGITGWRRRQKLPGSPDFVFRKQRLAVFVDGCFWHGCPKHATFPATRRAFWLKKLAGNKARDRRVTRELRRRGWRVLRIWEHELKHPSRCLARIRRALAVPRSSMRAALVSSYTGSRQTPHAQSAVGRPLRSSAFKTCRTGS